MLVVMVIHDVKPGRVDQARRRIDGNSERMAGQPGLVFRHTGMADGLENRIVTVTGWRNVDDRRAWDAAKSTRSPEIDPREVFDSVQSFTIEPYDQRWRSDLAMVIEGRR